MRLIVATTLTTLSGSVWEHHLGQRLASFAAQFLVDRVFAHSEFERPGTALGCHGNLLMDYSLPRRKLS